MCFKAVMLAPLERLFAVFYLFFVESARRWAFGVESRKDLSLLEKNCFWRHFAMFLMFRCVWKFGFVGSGWNSITNSFEQFLCIVRHFGSSICPLKITIRRPKRSETLLFECWLVFCCSLSWSSFILQIASGWYWKTFYCRSVSFFSGFN